MKLSIANTVAALLIATGCTPAQHRTPPLPEPNATILSIFTELGEKHCKQVPDLTDPNETPYLQCSGVAGYSLIVRRVDSGRKSIDVVDADRTPHPLQYQRIVTPHMFSLDDKVEWRVATQNGKQIPIALMVRIRAREGARNPAKVTNTYVAVAKITPSETCVVASVPDGSKSLAEMRSLADAAQKTPCAPLSQR